MSSGVHVGGVVPFVFRSPPEPVDVLEDIHRAFGQTAATSASRAVAVRACVGRSTVMFARDALGAVRHFFALYLIETVQSAQRRTTSVRVAGHSRQFAFRFEDDVLAYVDATEVFVAGRVQDGDAAHRGDVRARVAVAGQLSEVRLFL